MEKTPIKILFGASLHFIKGRNALKLMIMESHSLFCDLFDEGAVLTPALDNMTSSSMDRRVVYLKQARCLCVALLQTVDVEICNNVPSNVMKLHDPYLLWPAIQKAVLSYSWETVKERVMVEWVELAPATVSQEAVKSFLTEWAEYFDLVSLLNVTNGLPALVDGVELARRLVKQSGIPLKEIHFILGGKGDGTLLDLNIAIVDTAIRSFISVDSRFTDPPVVVAVAPIPSPIVSGGNPFPQQRYCFGFARGDCRFGDNCKFAHIKPVSNRQQHVDNKRLKVMVVPNQVVTSCFHTLANPVE